MPCRSEYRDPDNIEIELSKVYALLDEVYNGKVPGKTYGNGHDSRVYGKAYQSRLDEKTAELCQELRKQRDISRYSLEMQIWWRDHLAADFKRAQVEEKEKKDRLLKERALSKLTAEEKRVLGLK